MTNTIERAPNVSRDGDDHCTEKSAISPISKHGLDWLNFFLADVQTGVGPFLAIYLSSDGWNTQKVGVVLTVGGLAGIVAQTPAGALVDRIHAKRALLAVGVVSLAIGAMMIAFMPNFWSVLAAQSLIGVMSSVFIPGVCAVSLGLVGARAFDHRQGRNQTFNSAGNVVAAIGMGLIGYFLSNRGIFFFVVVMILPTLACLRLIRPDEIDYDIARGSAPGEGSDKKKSAGSIVELLKDRSLLIFLACCVMFHFANAAMLPLLGEMISHGKGNASMAFMSGCVITTQLVMTLLAGLVGVNAAKHGRKKLLLIGFAALPIRGVLYTLTDNAYLLIGIQVLDGIAGAVFSVVSVLVIADLTRGTGRFNLAQGAIATAVGIGASLSQVIAGHIVHTRGFDAGFLFLAAVAAAGFVLLWLAMPETLQDDDASSKHEPAGTGALPEMA